ncbi:PLDc N-terminal domain-containing protein, partial [Enterococcus lactis]
MLLNILYYIIIINEILALITVFREERDIAATWAWLLVLSFLPVLGFLIYAFVGRKLPKKRLFRFQYKDNKLMYDILKEQSKIHNNPKKIRADEVSYSYRT